MVGLDEGSSINFSDARTRLILKGGFERVKEWRQNLPDDIMTGEMSHSLFDPC